MVAVDVIHPLIYFNSNCDSTFERAKEYNLYQKILFIRQYKNYFERPIIQSCGLKSLVIKMSNDKGVQKTVIVNFSQIIIFFKRL